MAEKRMFAKTIIDSDAFLDMPLSTQALYFHLSMRADDEGFINNPKRIQRTIGASDDDLKLLVAKSFIIPFESGVVVIKHWKIHNCIRKERIHETKYVEEKSLLRVKDNGSYTLSDDAWQTDGRLMSDKCLTDGSLDKIRLDKIRLDKVSVEEEDRASASAPQPEMTFYEIVTETWNRQTCTKNIISIRPLTKREDMIRGCLLETDEHTFLKTIEAIDGMAWFKKRKDDNNPVTFDWFVDPNNFRKVLEGNYTQERGNKDKEGMVWL